jgi:hypothetical protein
MGAGAESRGDLDPRAVTGHSLCPCVCSGWFGLVELTHRVVCLPGHPCPGHRASESSRPFYGLGDVTTGIFFTSTEEWKKLPSILSMVTGFTIQKGGKSTLLIT